MKNHVTAIAVVALLALAAQSAIAGNVVGYNKITVPAGTDVRLSVPFNQTKYLHLVSCIYLDGCQNMVPPHIVVMQGMSGQMKFFPSLSLFKQIWL